MSKRPRGMVLAVPAVLGPDKSPDTTRTTPTTAQPHGRHHDGTPARPLRRRRADRSGRRGPVYRRDPLADGISAVSRARRERHRAGACHPSQPHTSGLRQLVGLPSVVAFGDFNRRIPAPFGVGRRAGLFRRPGYPGHREAWSRLLLIDGARSARRGRRLDRAPHRRRGCRAGSQRYGRRRPRRRRCRRSPSRPRCGSP
jgi:hypothetical protein